MKLVLASPLYPPEAGGPATYAKLLVDGLPQKGVSISLVLFSAVRKYPKGIRHLIYFLKVVNAARTADVILALDPVSVGFPAALASFFSGKPLLVKVVGDFAWEQGSQRFGITASLDKFVRQGRVPFPVAVLRAAQTFVAHRAQKIIVPSNYLRSIVTAWGIAPEKITVIYNSIELPVFEHAQKRAEGVIVSASRLVPWKGVSELIDAVAHVRTTVPAASLLIVGDGPEKETLMKKGAEKLGEHVSFAGSRTHEETLQALRAAEVFVLNSSYEGFSHVLVEACMLGCAIITTTAGGNPEIITDGENGLLIQTGTTTANSEALTRAITRVLMDTNLRTYLQENARASATRFTLENMLTQTASIVQSVHRP
jgi:glycosyltransferase involved in cell wall biosynthesis